MRLIKNIKINILVGIYVLFSIGIIYLLYNHTVDKTLEIIFKVIALMALSFLYLQKVKRVNFYFITILLINIVTDVLLTFESAYINQAISLLLINKLLYLLMLSDVFRKNSTVTILLYTLPHFITGTVIFYFLNNELEVFNLYIFLVYVALVVLGGITFINVITKNSLKSVLYFIGIFLISIAEVIMAISLFVGRNIWYIIMYYAISFVARFIMYRAIIRRK